MSKLPIRLTAIVGCLLVSILVFVNARQTTLASPGPDAPFETRCGWFQNPTPANIWLDDRDGEWIIGVQGGYQVESDWDWPAFKKGQWVETNGTTVMVARACAYVWIVNPGTCWK